jgi:hypothetical protein
MWTLADVSIKPGCANIRAAGAPVHDQLRSDEMVEGRSAAGAGRWGARPVPVSADGRA